MATPVPMTRAEQETTLRWDNDARTLMACTADAGVAAKWRKAKLPVRVLGTVDGQARTWAFDLPWDGSMKTWTRAFRASVRRFRVMGEADESAEAR